MLASSMQFRRYKRRPDQAVSAVQLALETDGFHYRKWGGEQRCKAGDYLVDNDGDVYTVDRASFERTYRKVSPGRYLKVTPVWAWQSDAAGDVKTKEGVTQYAAHDYLASNDASGDDTYAVGQAKFEAMYELDPE